MYGEPTGWRCFYCDKFMGDFKTEKRFPGRYHPAHWHLLRHRANKSIWGEQEWIMAKSEYRRVPGRVVPMCPECHQMFHDHFGMRRVFVGPTTVEGLKDWDVSPRYKTRVIFIGPERKRLRCGG